MTTVTTAAGCRDRDGVSRSLAWGPPEGPGQSALSRQPGPCVGRLHRRAPRRPGRPGGGPALCRSGWQCQPARRHTGTVPCRPWDAESSFETCLSSIPARLCQFRAGDAGAKPVAALRQCASPLEHAGQHGSLKLGRSNSCHETAFREE